MKLLLLFAAVLALALAAPSPQKPGEPYIEELSNTNDGLGTYSFGFKTSNGIIRQENGIHKNVGTDDEVLEVRGTITWIGEDNKEYSINFLANEDGYQVSP